EAGLERLVDRELVAGFSIEGDGRIVAHGWHPRSDGLAGIGLRPRRGSRGHAMGRHTAPNARTPVLFGPAFELLTHPQGVRLDGHLLRGGAATRTVDHCTSPPFVPKNRTRTLGGAQARERLRGPPRGGVPPAPPAQAAASQRSPV